jgi:putative transcriptional regulator
VSGERKIAPGLLLAMPQLADPNFARSVVLMVEHNEEGSFGLIVNQPAEQHVGEILGQLGITWNGDSNAVVRSGGPVMPQSGWLIHEPTTLTDPDDSILLAPGIALSTSETQLRRLAERPPRNIYFVMGYAGWGPAQLEYELSEGAWLSAETTSALVFDTPSEELWEASIRSLGIEPATLIPATGVH